MIVAALFALQLTAATSLVVRDVNHSVRIPVVASRNGPMVWTGSLNEIMPIDLRRTLDGTYTLEVWGTRMELEAGASVVRIGDEVRQLVSAPMVQNGRLMVPLQLISDVFPAVVPNTRWDAEKSELVVFSAGMPARSSGGSSRQSAGDVGMPARRSSEAPSTRASALPPVAAKHFRRTIVVDAGHGGVDNGMTGPIAGGPRIYEKNITLAVANKLGEQLKSRGVDVVYTRTADTLIALDDRGRIANRASGDLFISIHVNAANPNWKDPGGSRGFETYFLSEAKTEDARRVERMENESVQLEDGGGKGDRDPLSFILSDMTQNQHLRESSELADLIQQSLGKMHPGPSRGVKQAGFRVLVTAYMPSVLVEIGFGSNPRDAAFISDPRKQDALATAIADAAMEYLQRYERRVTGAGTDPNPSGPTR
ncbi:MAG: N-acetylmuramoyl-L-alanine amidase [bacterium]